MKRKLLNLMLAIMTAVICMVALSMSSSASTTKDHYLPFEDVKDTQWFAEATEYCYVNGVISGMNEYTFSPLSKLTRAQFVTMLANIEGVDMSKYSTDKFADVKPSHWCYGAVAWAYENDIVSGTSETKFSPNTYINRETMSRIMMQYMQNKGCSVTVNKGTLDKYTDNGKISSWATDGMNYAVSSGLVSGMTDTKLDPQGQVTRAQVVQILKQYLQIYCYNEAHENSYTKATCTEPSTCKTCGMKRGLPLGHSVSDSFNCKSNGQSKCTRCGYWVSASSMPHDYAAATCGKPETCKRCSATRGSATGKHTWWAATCKNPKMCKVCYKTEGKALGHSWKAANCVNPKTCTKCKLTEGNALTTNKQHSWWAATCKNPKMCKVCYATEGSKAPHTWWAATCKNPKMCKVCYTTEGTALAHTKQVGFCSNCKNFIGTRTKEALHSHLQGVYKEPVDASVTPVGYYEFVSTPNTTVPMNCKHIYEWIVKIARGDADVKIESNGKTAILTLDFKKDGIAPNVALKDFETFINNKGFKFDISLSIKTGSDGSIQMMITDVPVFRNNAKTKYNTYVKETNAANKSSKDTYEQLRKKYNADIAELWTTCDLVIKAVNDSGAIGVTSERDAVDCIITYLCKKSTYYTAAVTDFTLDARSIKACLNNGKAVCDGYAKSFYAMCYYLGIDVKYCYGLTDKNVEHAWNYINTVDGKTTYFDVTWYDKLSGAAGYVWCNENNFKSNHERKGSVPSFW